MDTFLTLVIALGGIATGIGAIWTAMLARRQLDEQRQFLQEQNETARRQVQLTERSLAQTESSLSEPVQSLREQNERARLTLEYDLLTRLMDRAVSPYWLSRRREAARYLLDNVFVGDEMVKVPSLNNAAMEVCALDEEMGELVRQGVLRADLMWSRFGRGLQAYWLLCKPAIEKVRQEYRYESRITKVTELRFRVILGDGTREVSFERSAM
jgi:hypothetical protein